MGSVKKVTQPLLALVCMEIKDTMHIILYILSSNHSKKPQQYSKHSKMVKVHKTLRNVPIGYQTTYKNYDQRNEWVQKDFGSIQNV